ncbi:MAG: hypothetical protein H6735_17600 [Alphaproteobacteria bacterium]|nr:hypothetical protein [Alphaproteobacteria bacterium]
MRLVVVFAFTWGCGAPPAVEVPARPSAETGAPDDTGAPTPEHTAEPPTPLVTELSCTPTDNALRVDCETRLDVPGSVELRWRRADGSGGELSRRSEAASLAHRTRLWFLAPQTAYTVEASADGFATSVAATFTSGTPPRRVAARLEVTGEADTPLVGTNLPCDIASAEAGMFDTATGELVWYEIMDRSGSFGGFEMLQFTEDRTVLGLTGDHVVEMDLGGHTLLRRPYDLPYHHDLFRRNGKTWLLYSDPVRADLVLDGFVVWDAAGTEVARWREAEALPIPAGARGDWSHASSIWVGPDESVLLSLEARDTILAVSPAGEVHWAIGGGAPTALLEDWSAIEGADGFAMPHAASRTPDGGVQLLDNAHGRALRLAVDEGSGLASAVASFDAGAPRCGPQGTASLSAAGGVLAGCSGPNVRQYTPSGDAIRWSATLSCDSGEGTSGGPRGGQLASRWYALDGWGYTDGRSTP